MSPSLSPATTMTPSPSPASTSTSTFPFLRLPVELLLHIASYLSLLRLSQLLLTCHSCHDIFYDTFLKATLHAKKFDRALLHASVAGYTSLAQSLLELPHSEPRELSYALHAASREGYASIVSLLLSQPDHPHPGDLDVLQVAADNGNEEVVRTLLSLTSADPHNAQTLGFILRGPARNGYTRTARVLLEAGADPEAAPSTWRPLHSAAKMGHVGVVRVLLEFGAVVDAVSQAGKDLPQTPMLLSARAVVCGWLAERNALSEALVYEEVKAQEEYWMERRERARKCAALLIKEGADVGWGLHLLDGFVRGEKTKDNRRELDDIEELVKQVEREVKHGAERKEMRRDIARWVVKERSVDNNEIYSDMVM